MDAREVVAARRAGEFAGRSGLHPSTCPHRGNDTDTHVLRRIWLAAYLRAAGPPPGAVDHDDGAHR
jgi:hypothetical protein